MVEEWSFFRLKVQEKVDAYWILMDEEMELVEVMTDAEMELVVDVANVLAAGAAADVEVNDVAAVEDLRTPGEAHCYDAKQVATDVDWRPAGSSGGFERDEAEVGLELGVGSAADSVAISCGDHHQDVDEK